jgi:hypothetical protein
VWQRLRRAPKAPLSVAGILATPLFFVALMSFSLRVDEPSVEVTRAGAEVLGDPLRTTVWTIYLLAFAFSACEVLVGVGALLLPTRVGVIVASLGAIALTILLVLPLDTWEGEHVARYPLGVDLIPRNDPSDLILRGEWEENARRTAQEIGFWTIVIACVAIALTLVFEFRRRRGLAGPPPPPPPPEVAAGEPQIVPRSPRSS